MSESNCNLEFPNFDEIKVSTRTFISMTNLNIDLSKLFNFLPITKYTVIPKKRGRKKKNNISEPNKDILPGSIITLKFENKIRGIDLKKNKTKTLKEKWFRNSFTVVIFIENKIINFKICQNGMFQITGCKTEENAHDCIRFIWEYIKNEKDIYKFSRGHYIESYFIPAMRNIDFDLGFLIDREKLAIYMSNQTKFHSLLETSFGYTGVNIKIPIIKDINTLEIKKLCYKDDKWEIINIFYEDYLKLLPEKQRIKKITKKRYNTFLVFHSGKVIMSSINEKFAIDTYYYFLDIIKSSYNEIKEILD